MFCPTLDISRSDAGDVSIALNVERLTAFLDLCMA